MDFLELVIPTVDPVAFTVAAAILGVERLTYIAVWHWPAWFDKLCRERWLRSPVDVLASLFVGFKFMQLAVFVGWCLLYGGRVIPGQRSAGVLWAAAVLVGAGQALNLSVFRSLGRTGVFYGSRFGHYVPWRGSFPFSWFDHPQYVGALLTIWGFFVLTRYPAPDWTALPLLQTVYYAFGAYFEENAAPTPVIEQ
jgi:methylene-fatty-acyl-phospholipid synthase